MYAIILPMSLFGVGLGIVLPQTQAGAMAPFPEKAGAAAGLMGSLQMGLAGLIGYAIAFLHNGTQFPMVMAIGLLSLLSASSFYGLVYRHRRAAFSG